MKKYLILAILCLMALNAWSGSEPKEEYPMGGTGRTTSRGDLEKLLIAELNRLDVQYNCSEVKISYYTTGGGWRECRASFSCVPRSLKQKQILSLQRACEKEAREECFEKEFLDYLESFEESKFTHTNKPRCEHNT